jgi:hypothetical protein
MSNELLNSLLLLRSSEFTDGLQNSELVLENTKHKTSHITQTEMYIFKAIYFFIKLLA